jgi:hypothetical protein
MKKAAILSFLCIMLSCETEQSTVPDSNNLTIVGYAYKVFNGNDQVTDSTFYGINNNRIVSASGLNLATQQTNSATYSYQSDKIDEITNFMNGQMTSKRTFTYAGDNLSEMILETQSQNGASYEKWTFDHSAADTIFLTHSRSSDGINFDNTVSDSKIVLDDHDNRVYFENFDHINQEITAVTMAFDSNDNPVSENYLTYLNGNFVSTQTLSITHDGTVNSLYELLENTYGKKTLMLTYHLRTNAINQINARNISPNNIDSFSTTLSGQFSFQITNQIGQGGFSEMNQFKSFSGATLLRHFETNFLLN